MRYVPLCRSVCLGGPGCVFVGSVVERRTPLQRDYNAIINRINEHTARMTAGNILAEQGSLVNEALLDEGFEPGTVVEYRAGATPPVWMPVSEVPESLLQRLTDLLQRPLCRLEPVFPLFGAHGQIGLAAGRKEDFPPVGGGKRHHGNECAAQDGQLTNIIYNRDGMCHTIVNITGSGLPYAIQKTIVEDLFGEGCLDAPKDDTPMNESKARFAKFGIMRQVLHDSFTLCNWVWPMTFSPRKERGYKGDLSVEAQYMSAITGQEWSEEELDHAVERCIQLHRAMTVKAAGTTDMRNNHDVISNFIFDMDPDKQPFTPGTVKLDREDWQKALTMFYQQFGWHPPTGTPTPQTLEKFDLKDVADDLEALNLLP